MTDIVFVLQNENIYHTYIVCCIKCYYVEFLITNLIFIGEPVDNGCRTNSDCPSDQECNSGTCISK